MKKSVLIYQKLIVVSAFRALHIASVLYAFRLCVWYTEKEEFIIYSFLFSTCNFKADFWLEKSFSIYYTLGELDHSPIILLVCKTLAPVKDAQILF